MHSRRKFLHQLGLGCSSVGATTLLSGITNLGLLNTAAAANSATNVSNGYKALVCIFLAGGNDSYNMLVPTDPDNYAEYQQVRGNLSLSNLQQINPTNISNGRMFGLHPNLVKVKQMFNKEAPYSDANLSFIANVGALVEPTSISSFQTNSNLPVGLFSHRDQANHWQTSVPQDRNALGWGGRLADKLCTGSCLSNNISMNISLDGVNTFQRGNNINSYSISTEDNGSIAIRGSHSFSFYETLKRETVENVLDQNFNNILQQAYSKSVIGSTNSSLEFSSAIANGQAFNTVFQDDDLSKRLQMVARTIAARNLLGVTNQTFFVQLGGFDTHDDIINKHGELLTHLDNGLSSFHEALKELGLDNDVTTFTISDFARKLLSNGDGSDHGWGGHAVVMGGSVDGKKIFGEYPNLYLGNSLDVGEGRIIPTTSCDEYFAELALWFGASSADLDYILPNINNFWTPQATGPIGFLN